MRIVVAGVVLALARVATASPPGMTEPAVAAAAPVVPQPGALERAAEGDAAYDRGFFVSTALALHPGQFDMSLRSALKTGAILSVAAGLGRGIEVSVDGAKVGAVGKSLGVGAKLELVHHATWSVAMTASVHNLYPENSDQTDRTYVATMRITTCTGGDCNAQFTFGGGFGAQSSSYMDVAQTLTPELDASFVIGKSWCRPMLELTIFEGEQGYLGLRFGGRHVAFDVGVGAIAGDTQLGNNDLLALVGLSVRP